MEFVFAVAKLTKRLNTILIIRIIITFFVDVKCL